MTRMPSRAARLAAAAVTVVAVLVAPRPARADHIRTFEADVAEDVASIEGEGEALVVKTATRAIPVAEVKEVIFPAAEREARIAPAHLFLVTGDELAGEITGGDENMVALKSPALGPLEVKFDLVRAVAITSDEADLRRFRKDVLPLEAKQDIVVTRSWTNQEGQISQIDPRGVAFSTEGLSKVTLGADKIIGARLAPLGARTPAATGLRARLDLTDGGVVSGKLKSYRSGIFAIDAAFKAGLLVKGAETRSLSFLGGRIVYLSDLDPVETDEHAKIISLVFKHREDANVMGNPLRVDGKGYRKGVGVHAFTRLAYKLDAGFSRFRAVVGLDDEARERRDVVGTIRFQVLVDGKPMLGERGVTLSTRDPARPIDVDVAGASSIALVADFGESQDTLARGAWADAYLVKK